MDKKHSELGIEYSISEELPSSQTYPTTDIYEFGEFAGPIFEMGGYGDITMIDPYTGRRLWVGGAFQDGDSIYDAMTKAISVAEEIGFLKEEK